MPAHSWHFFQTFDVVRVGKKNQSYFQPQAGESELFSSKMAEDQNAELFVSNWRFCSGIIVPEEQNTLHCHKYFKKNFVLHLPCH